jgi:hypothetical protein
LAGDDPPNGTPGGAHGISNRPTIGVPRESAAEGIFSGELFFPAHDYSAQQFGQAFSGLLSASLRYPFRRNIFYARCEKFQLRRFRRHRVSKAAQLPHGILSPAILEGNRDNALNRKP